MFSHRWQWLTEFRKLWEPPLPEPASQSARIYNIQRNIALPAKIVILVVVFYYLFYSHWMESLVETRSQVLETIQWIMAGYILITAGIAASLFVCRQFPLHWVQWFAVLSGIADGLFLASMTVVTNGFQSTLYWVFPVLIVINAVNLPLVAPQIILNLLLSAFFMGAGIIDLNIQLNAKNREFEPTSNQRQNDPRPPRSPRDGLTGTNATRLPGHPTTTTNAGARQKLPLDENLKVTPEIFLLRLIVLWLLTPCCYGIQVLAARQRQVEEEAREFAVRQSQLRTAGRLAAEIAHQIKNPLAIINNTAFSLQRAVRKENPQLLEQIRIIQEEVERSDRIITQLMGYARLTEGNVERLNVTDELDRALEEVLPPAGGYKIRVERQFGSDLPQLVMQRAHLSTVFVNLLQNAREAMRGRGTIRVDAHTNREGSVEIVIEDTGPGIPAEQSERIFEAYFTTKEKGTGLGLAIVKHNVDLYGGTLRVESALGKGARFVLVFPAKTLTELKHDSKPSAR